MRELAKYLLLAFGQKKCFRRVVDPPKSATQNLEKNNFIDKKTNKKIPEETLRLLRVQKDMMMKQLIQFPDLFYTKNNIPLEISQRAFDHLWRICESYELWCKETNQPDLLILNIID